MQDTSNKTQDTRHKKKRIYLCACALVLLCTVFVGPALAQSSGGDSVITNGDFENWVRHSLKNQELAIELRKIRTSKEKGEKLRKKIITTVKDHYNTLEKQISSSAGLF